MGHFTRFWERWNYPQSCCTRPKMPQVGRIKAAHRKTQFAPGTHRKPGVRDSLQRGHGPGDLVVLQQCKRHAMALRTPDRIAQGLLAASFQGEGAQPEAPLLGNREHGKVVTAIERQRIGAYLMEDRPAAVGPDMMDEVRDQLRRMLGRSNWIAQADPTTARPAEHEERALRRIEHVLRLT